MVATASTEHPIGCKYQPIGCSVEAVAMPTQAIAFGWKPGFTLSYGIKNRNVPFNRNEAATTSHDQ